MEWWYFIIVSFWCYIFSYVSFKWRIMVVCRWFNVAYNVTLRKRSRYRYMFKFFYQCLYSEFCWTFWFCFNSKSGTWNKILFCFAANYLIWSQAEHRWLCFVTAAILGDRGKCYYVYLTCKELLFFYTYIYAL